MPSWIVPSDTHVADDGGHATDHDHIADDLTLIATAFPGVTTGSATTAHNTLDDGSGNATVTGTLKLSSSATLQFGGSLDTDLYRLGVNSLATDGLFSAFGGLAANTLRIFEGSNAKQGVATLSSGTVAVSNTSVTTNSRIFLTAQDNNSTGALRVSARSAGMSFTITSSNGSDSGVVAYEIFEPA